MLPLRSLVAFGIQVLITVTAAAQTDDPLALLPGLRSSDAAVRRDSLRTMLTVATNASKPSISADAKILLQRALRNHARGSLAPQEADLCLRALWGFTETQALQEDLIQSALQGDTQRRLDLLRTYIDVHPIDRRAQTVRPLVLALVEESLSSTQQWTLCHLLSAFDLPDAAVVRFLEECSRATDIAVAYHAKRTLELRASSNPQ